MGFPVVFARAQPIALVNRQPTWVCVCGFVSWQTVWNMLLVICIVTMFACVWISTFSAISSSSTRSSGRLNCRAVRSVFVNDLPSACSNSFESAKPGGVSNMPVFC